MKRKNTGLHTSDRFLASEKLSLSDGWMDGLFNKLRFLYITQTDACRTLTINAED